MMGPPGPVMTTNDLGNPISRMSPLPHTDIEDVAAAAHVAHLAARAGSFEIIFGVFGDRGVVDIEDADDIAGAHHGILPQMDVHV